MNQLTRFTFLATTIVLSGCLVACSDDDGTDPGPTTTTSGTGATGGTAGSGGTGGMGGAGGAGGATADREWVVLVRGTLSTTDLAEAQGIHDGLASGGEQAAKAAGDFGHDAMLGTTLLGTEENAFLGIDRWNDLDGLQAFYANPDFQAGFATLFSGPPLVETFVHQPTWHSWGSLTAGDAHEPHFFVVARGRLAEADPVAAQAAHDAAAAGGEQAAQAAGDVAHLAFVGVEDAQEFLAIDVWSSSDNLEALYTDPAFQAAFGALFESPPTIGVYQSTDWHQW